MQKLTILQSLPGGGKTTYANEQAKLGWPRKNLIIDGDLYLRQPDRDRMLAQLCDVIDINIHHYKNDIIVDGLFLTNNIIEKVLTLSNINPKTDEVEIIRWKEDRETCLYNDKYRRSKDSSITIRNAAFEYPSDELIKKWGIKLIEKDVVKKPDWKTWAQQNEIQLVDDRYLEGDEWSTGGTAGNCWDNTKHQIDAETPKKFVELDNLLTRICPNINFLQYKKIDNDCCDIREDGYGDYYGGYVGNARHRCDIEKLYNLLKEFGHVGGTPNNV